MGKQNCWEYFECGRDPGGAKEMERGICPAAVDDSSHGLNGGRSAGRICWAVAGTLCEGDLHGIRAEREKDCSTCEFYKKVKAEEGFLQYKILKPEQWGEPSNR